MARLGETPSQTAGPFVHIGFAPTTAGFEAFPQVGRDIAGPNARGSRIRLEGLILDGEGVPMKDAMVELWQANAAGIYPHPADPRAEEVEAGFRGFGRASCDFGTGLWSVETVKPGRVGDMAPHVTLWVVARGINIGLHTRLYFADETEANTGDPLLALVGDARRDTLLAETTGGGRYRFDIHLQGDRETVFFDI